MDTKDQRVKKAYESADLILELHGGNKRVMREILKNLMMMVPETNTQTQTERA